MDISAVMYLDLRDTSLIRDIYSLKTVEIGGNLESM